MGLPKLSAIESGSKSAKRAKTNDDTQSMHSYSLRSRGGDDIHTITEIISVGYDAIYVRNLGGG
jgi:hypothetical protein